MAADRILVAVVVIAEDPRLPEMKEMTAVKKRRKRWLLEMTTTAAIVVVAVIAGEAALVAAAVTVITAEVEVAEVVAIVVRETTEAQPSIMTLTVVPCSEA